MVEAGLRAQEGAGTSAKGRILIRLKVLSVTHPEIVTISQCPPALVPLHPPTLLRPKNQPAQLDARLPPWSTTPSQPLRQQDVGVGPGAAGAPTHHKKIHGPCRQGQLLKNRLAVLPPTQGSGSRSRDRPVPPVASSSRQQTPRTSITVPPPQTPGRNAANRLLTQLNQQTQMASPGPRDRDFSDDSSHSSSDSNLPPAPLQPRRVARSRMQPLTVLHTDTEEESPANNRPSRPHVRPPHSRQPSGSQASAQGEGSQSDAWAGYQIDQAKYAWAEDATLRANPASADCQAFYGQHIEHYGYKCRLCS
ncbi:hypothetical protein B0H16DRAFT_1745262 [Mycena metata]|uniref:Uncharacterized protein n=1 Tax=Mycena metata TaxID=1033252 RepID=A0AAD7MCY2_9AGAR|nr:hypothetical protein B0H16DRAFT_1745262 [Mycena metata]